MKKLAGLGILITGTWAVYLKLGYQPCQIHARLITEDGRIIPRENCAGLDLIHNTNVAFDNLLLLVTSVGVAFAVAAQLRYTRHYSTRGLGILCLLIVLLGGYFRAIVMPRVLGLPLITKPELALLRAVLTWGGPLFVVGTLSWQWRRVRRDQTKFTEFQITHEPPPDL